MCFYNPPRFSRPLNTACFSDSSCSLTPIMSTFELDNLTKKQAHDSDFHSTSAAAQKAGSDRTVAEEAPVTSSKPGDFAQTKKEAQLANIQLGALFMSLFLAGWNDGTTGPLLPRIQQVYNVGTLNAIFRVCRLSSNDVSRFR